MDVVADDRVMTAEPTSSAAGGRPLPIAFDRRVVLTAVAAVLAAGGVVAAAGAFGGAARPSVLADPGAITRWGLLLTRTTHDVAAMCTLGVLAVAVLVLPTSAGGLLPDAARLVRLASRWATAWAAAALLGVLMGLSEATALPLPDVLTPDVLALGLELPADPRAGVDGVAGRPRRALGALDPLTGRRMAPAADGGRSSAASTDHRARRTRRDPHHGGRGPVGARRDRLPVGGRPGRAGAAPAALSDGPVGRAAPVQPDGVGLLRRRRAVREPSPAGRPSPTRRSCGRPRTASCCWPRSAHWASSESWATCTASARSAPWPPAVHVPSSPWRPPRSC